MNAEGGLRLGARGSWLAASGLWLAACGLRLLTTIQKMEARMEADLSAEASAKADGQGRVRRGSRFQVPGSGLREQENLHRQMSGLRRDGVGELAAVVLKRTLTGVEDGQHAEALAAVGDGLTT